MTAWVLLILFGVSCLILISHGLTSRTGILHFPFIAGCGLFGFLFPQAVGIVRNPWMAPEAGLNKALAMCTLCALAIHLGWRMGMQKPLEKTRVFISPRRYYFVGLVCLAVGLAGYLKLTSLSGGVLDYYSTSGNYALEWRGLPVAYRFFASYLFPGFVLVALAGFQMRSWQYLLPGAIVVLIQLATIVFLGRRTVLVSFGMATLCVLYFGKRILPPRWAVYLLAPVVMAAMFLAPQYRTHSQIGGETSKIREIDVGRTLNRTFSGESGEFWTMAYLMQVTDDEGIYQYGVGFYNTFVRMFVPRLLIGDEEKRALLIEIPDAGHVGPEAGSVPNRYGWQIAKTMVPTGPGSAFQQFWFLGCLFYFMLSRVLKGLLLRARTQGDLSSQVLYIALLTPSLASVVNDMYAIYDPLFQFVIPFSVASRVIRSQLLNSSHSSLQRIAWKYPAADAPWR